ncbi:MAG: hypothetical protein OIF57_03150 [Marinobacterium sp.]|nr:hypothetical protein [Marinobacterium sp.]
MIHPILAALPDGTNAEEFVQNLGFEVDFQFDGSSDLPDGLTLDDWKITIPEGFKLAGKWEADSGADDYFVACFLKPTTPLATAIWLIGLGQMVQDNPPKPFYSYLKVDDDYSDSAYTGRYATYSEAAEAAGETISHINQFRTPLSSEFISAEDIFTALFGASESYLPEGMDIWPDTPDKCPTLDPALQLLIDGWARHTGNEPTFALEVKKPGKPIASSPVPGLASVEWTKDTHDQFRQAMKRVDELKGEQS